MEKSLDEVANDVCKVDGVIGYLCADNNGLCLTSSGIGDKSLCPTLVRISKLASKLDETKKDALVLCFEADGYKVLSKQHGQTTTAIYKKT